MVGGSIGAEKKDDDKVIIGIGLGNFKSMSRLLSLHGTFMTYFVKKAHSLGYLVLGVNEYYTSKKCLKCEKFVGQPRNIRHSYCRNCKKYIHYDSMAGRNMVNVLHSYVERQERPDYLHPVDEDGNYPWKESYKHEAQSMSTSSASKGAGSKSGHDCKWPVEGGGDVKDNVTKKGGSDDKDSMTEKKMKSKTMTAGASKSARGHKRRAKEGDSDEKDSPTKRR
ncbi:hypothetical protein BGZ92_005802 [Podila epicladia]|nr:hypothetical protein BGZ92_005802 [Podila epicladia]